MVKTNKNQVAVNFILDRSGSMSSCAEGTISGFNEYLKTLKADKKTDYTFSLTLFDDFIEKPIVAKNIKKVADLTNGTFVPRGSTALYDAVCKTIKDFKTTGKTITVIMTDGGENSSKEFTQVHMREMIKKLEATKKHTFVYLGANQDAYAVAHSFGFAAQNTSNFNATGGGGAGAMRTLGVNTVAYSAQATSATNDFFSKEDQKKLEDTK